MNKDAFARRKVAVQTWFVDCAALILASIVGLQYFRGVVAPDPSVPSVPGILSSIALVLGLLGLIALLGRSRNAVIYRCAGSLPASIGFGVVVMVYAGWLYFSVLGYINSAGGR